MKLKAVAVVLALVGCATSVAVAKGPPPGNARSQESRATAALCHRTGSRHPAFRLLRVSRSAVETHMRHGDLLATPGSGCASRPPANGSSATS